MPKNGVLEGNFVNRVILGGGDINTLESQYHMYRSVRLLCCNAPARSRRELSRPLKAPTVGRSQATRSPILNSLSVHSSPIAFVTGAINRYPRRATVSMNRRLSDASPSASRNRVTRCHKFFSRLLIFRANPPGLANSMAACPTNAPK